MLQHLLQVILRNGDEVVKKKRVALQTPLTLRRLENIVSEALTIPRSWDIQFYYGEDEDRRKFRNLSIP